MNTFYNNYRERKAQLKQGQETRERSFGEQMFPIVVAGNIAKGIIHLLSFCGASILPAYAFDLLFGSFYIGLILGVISVLVFIEVPKWAVVGTISENFFNSGFISYGLCCVAVLFIAPSIASSTYGVPIAVFWLAPDAAVIDIEEIETKYALLSGAAVSRWEPQISKHAADKKEYFKTCKKWYANEGDNGKGRYRLPSSKQGAWNKMDAAEKKSTAALNARLDTIQSNLDAAVLEATAENKATAVSHDFKKQHTGNIAFWVMLCLEFCYIGIVFGLGYIEHRSELEQEGIEPNQSGNVVAIRTESNQSEQERPIEKQAVAKHNPIKFGNIHHGKTFTPKGGTKQRVWYKKEDGTYKDYTKSDLIRFSNRDKGTKDFKDECKRLASLMD